jgi:TRAP-type C4-dicarboxylate transport system permease large subunit
VIFLVLIGGLIFSRMLVASGVIDSFVAEMTRVAGGPAGFIVLAALLYLILGCFIDTTSMMVVTLPFLFPVVKHFEIDPIWFGILVVKLIEISVITPPVGMNLFAVMSAADKDTRFSDLVRGVMPFIAMEMVVLCILVAFPQLSLWLPEKMLGR